MRKQILEHLKRLAKGSNEEPPIFMLVRPIPTCGQSGGGISSLGGESSRRFSENHSKLFKLL
jgi:hypothetical protein